MAAIKQITKRFLPGEDLRKGIEKMVKENEIYAGCVISIVGSLSKAALRMADAKIVKSWSESFEIVSGTGTVSKNDCHIHIAISDKDGKVIGGHLKEGCVVRTTAEIVLLVFSDVKYQRKFDKESGYEELVIE